MEKNYLLQATRNRCLNVIRLPWCTSIPWSRGRRVSTGSSRQHRRWATVSSTDLLATGRTEQTWYGGTKQFSRHSYNDTRRVELSIRYYFQPAAAPANKAMDGAGKNERQRFNTY